MDQATERQLEARLVLYSDFEIYAQTALSIRPKEGDIVPLKFNQAQQILHEAVEKQKAATGRVRVIILKGRQQGLSTYVEGRGYWFVSQRRGRRGFVLAHKDDSSTTLFNMLKRYHDHAPTMLKPSNKYSNKKELSFDKLDSSFVVATAGGTGLGRSETLQFVHASEVAFWKKETAKENWNGIEQAVPDVDDTEVYIESTANGVTGVFYDMWRGAVEGRNDYLPVFIPWFVQDEYRAPVEDDFVRTPDEEDLAALYGLDDEQLQWRRWKVNKNGLDLFKQEYPCCPEEAFLSTGRPVFDPAIIRAMQQHQQVPPSTLLALNGETWEENSRGELSVWELPQPGENYTIGADCSAGVRGGDPSCAIVQNSKKQVVARWRGWVDPDFYATVLYNLGVFYNMAFICPENNNHGILTCARLGKDMAYPFIYQTTHYDKVVDKETTRLGFTTTVQTKPLIIDELRAELRDGNVRIPDEVTLSELSTYVMTETGAMEAEKGSHDDCVIALALATHANEGSFTPITNDEAWYITPP